MPNNGGKIESLKAEIIALNNDNFSIKDIAKKIFVSSEGVRSALIRWGIVINNTRISRFTEEQVREIEKMYKLGYTYKEIALKFNVIHWKIKYLIRNSNFYDLHHLYICLKYKQEIIELYNKNIRINDIAKKFNVAIVSISHNLKRWGCEKKNSERKKFCNRLNIDPQQVIISYNKIKNSQKVGEIYGVGKGTINCLLRENGIKLFSEENYRKFINDIDVIYNLYIRDIKSINELAKQYYVSRKRIIGIFKKRKLKLFSEVRVEEANKIKDSIFDLYYNKFLSCQEIGDIYPLFKGSICNLFDEWGWKCRNSHYKNTSLERNFQKMLDNLKIEYKLQYRISNRFYDFYLPKYNLLIETNGDFWHANPNKYSILYELQIKSRERDIFKKELANNRGYKILFIWEQEMNEMPDKIIYMLSKLPEIPTQQNSLDMLFIK